jgi:hypothetical protein
MWLLALIIGVSAERADAGLLAYEGFNYGPAGSDLLGDNGGFGFNGAWTSGGVNATVHNNYDLASGSLLYPNLQTYGNSILTAATQSIAGIERNLNTVFGDGQTVYFSFLVQPQGTLGDGAFNGFFGVYLGTSTPNLPDNLFIGKPGSSAAADYDLETRGGGGVVSSDVAPVIGSTTLLVVKAELLTGNDRFTLYVNPTVGAPEPASGFVKTDINLSAGPNAGISSLVVYSSGAFALDEIRVGTTFADVTAPVPEPTSLAMFGLGAIGLIWRLRPSKQT